MVAAAALAAPWPCPCLYLCVGSFFFVASMQPISYISFSPFLLLLHMHALYSVCFVLGNLNVQKLHMQPIFLVQRKGNASNQTAQIRMAPLVSFHDLVDNADVPSDDFSLDHMSVRVWLSDHDSSSPFLRNCNRCDKLPNKACGPCLSLLPPWTANLPNSSTAWTFLQRYHDC